MREHRNGGRRHRAEQQHIHADRGEARDHGGFDHIAGEPRILADHRAMAMIAALKQDASRLCHLHRQFRRDHLIGEAANSIGPEMLSQKPASCIRRVVEPLRGENGPKRLVGHYLNHSQMPNIKQNQLGVTNPRWGRRPFPMNFFLKT